jgi:hypothetical protein
MNPFEMVVLIILIVTIGKVASARFGNGSRTTLRSAGRRESPAVEDSIAVAEAARLRNEVSRLNERIQVLERLATDPGKRLADEIDALKDK